MNETTSQADNVSTVTMVAYVAVVLTVISAIGIAICYRLHINRKRQLKQVEASDAKLSNEFALYTKMTNKQIEFIGEYQLRVAGQNDELTLKRPLLEPKLSLLMERINDQLAKYPEPNEDMTAGELAQLRKDSQKTHTQFSILVSKHVRLLEESALDDLSENSTSPKPTGE